MEKNPTNSDTFYHRIKGLVTPSVFEDEEKTRVAMILGIILWSVVAVVGTLVMMWLIRGKYHELGPYAVAANTFIIGVAIGLLFLIRKGYVKSAGIAFVAFCWINMTFQAFTSDGVRGSAAIIYIAIMVLGGLLLGRRASIGVTVLSTLSLWILAYIEESGFMSFQQVGIYEAASEATGVFILIVVFLTLTTTGLSNALKRARNSEQSLMESNRALQYNLEKLKQRENEGKELQNQLLQAQKMEAIGTLAGGIAHDFNNSLQGILGYTQILIYEKKEENSDFKLLEQIERAAKRSSELTKQLLTFSRKLESQLRPLDLNQEVRQLKQLLERTIPKMIGIETHLGSDLKIINGDPIQIEQMIMNLSINARDAMVDGGKLVIECRNTTLDENYCKRNLDVLPGEFVWLRVSDNGKGMDKQTLVHIFEPFFTTKETGQGTGLGLAMVYGIVKNHGGHITCDSKPAEGTTFNIYFPAIAETQRQQAIQSGEMEHILRGNETILLVDDEDYLRDLGRHLLTKFGYTVFTAPDGETAVELYREKGPQISLVILDLIMPGIGGRNCLDLILKEDPSARVIIASGYSVEPSTLSELGLKSYGFITKPFELNQMLNMVRRALDEKISPGIQSIV
jgi:signal transduction histidine kinase/ActR/RegA family two-component response regulator